MEKATLTKQNAEGRGKRFSEATKRRIVEKIKRGRLPAPQRCWGRRARRAGAHAPVRGLTQHSDRGDHEANREIPESHERGGDLREREHVERELILIKVASKRETRSEIMQIVDIFRGRIVDVHHESLIVEISGTPDKNDALLELLQPFGILEIARTGRIALFRGPEFLRVPE